MTEYYVTYSKAKRYKFPQHSQNRADLDQTQKAHALAQRQLNSGITRCTKLTES